MKLSVLEIVILIAVWWWFSMLHNYLDWQWQLNYDKAMQEEFEMGSIE